jgi:hypothetical protein
MSAEKIRAGLTLGLKQMTDRVWEADLCLVSPKETAGRTAEIDTLQNKPKLHCAIMYDVFGRIFRNA